MRLIFAIVTVALATLSAQERSYSDGQERFRPVEKGNASIEGAVLDELTHGPIKKATVNLSGRVHLTAVTDPTGTSLLSRPTWARARSWPAGLGCCCRTAPSESPWNATVQPWRYRKALARTSRYRSFPPTN